MKTVFKLKKIQTLQHLANIGKHCYEISEKEKTKFLNERAAIFKKPIWTLIGNNSKLYSDVKKMKEDLKLEKRKNSAVGVEIVLSMSPDFFDLNGDKDLAVERVKDFTNRSMKFIKDKFGKNRIAHAVLHLHETTPHIHILLIPWEEQTKRGRYDSSPYRLIKTKSITPKFLSNTQNEYWNVFKDYNLKPLNKKRPENITTLKDHYLNSIEEVQEKEKIISEKEALISEIRAEVNHLRLFINLILNSLKSLGLNSLVKLISPRKENIKLSSENDINKDLNQPIKASCEIETNSQNSLIVNFEEIADLLAPNKTEIKKSYEEFELPEGFDLKKRKISTDNDFELPLGPKAQSGNNSEKIMDRPKPKF